MAVVPNHYQGQGIFLSREPGSANVPYVVAIVEDMFKFVDLGLSFLLRFRPACDSYAAFCLSFRISVFALCFDSGLPLYIIGPWLL